MRAVVVRRAAKRATTQRGQRKPPPPVEAFFTTDLTLSPQDILAEYSKRWAVEIEIATPMPSMVSGKISVASANAS